MIPATAHFVWIGRRFDWLSWVAVASAARNGGFERVVLHHTDPLAENRWFQALGGLDGVRVQRLDALEAVERAGGARIADSFRRLTAPAARSNVLRVALLRAEGGVYLDMDTVTVRSLSTLRLEASFFCGTEHVAFPGSLRQSRSPRRWSGAFARTALRDVLRRSNRGVRWFQKVKGLYPAVANNAVLGATREHPFLLELLDRMRQLPQERALQRFALGTHLLQQALSESPQSDVRVHGPELFYPLGPEISEHWFREHSRATLEDVLGANTRVVHWYASVRTRDIAPKVDPAWVDQHRGRCLLADLLHATVACGGTAPFRRGHVSGYRAPAMNCDALHASHPR